MNAFLFLKFGKNFWLLSIKLEKIHSSQTSEINLFDCRRHRTNLGRRTKWRHTASQLLTHETCIPCFSPFEPFTALSRISAASILPCLRYNDAKFRRAEKAGLSVGIPS